MPQQTINRVNTTTTIKALLLIVAIALSSSHAYPQQQPPADENNPDQSRLSSSALPKFTATLSVDRTSAFVSEQVLITVEVLAPKSAFNLRQQKLEVTGADIYVLQKKTTDSDQQGELYQLVSTRYALYFKQAGTYSIPSLTITATLPVSAGGDDASNNPKITATTQQQSISVSPAPVGSTSWLPAISVTARSSWLANNASAEFVAGQPASKRIEVQISGQFPSAIPSLYYVVPDGIRLYVSPPEIQKHYDKEGVRGTMTQVISIIPESAGVYQLPSLNIHWWDLVNQQWNQTLLAAETIRVRAPDTNNAHDTEERKLTVIMAITATVLCSIGIAGYLLLTRGSTRPLHLLLQRTLFHTVLPGKFSGTGPPTEKQTWTKLRKALNSKSAKDVRAAVVIWHSTINRSTAIHRLDQISDCDDGLTLTLIQLDEFIYGRSANSDINYKLLGKSLTGLRHRLKHAATGKPTAPVLADAIVLYPVRKGHAI